MSAAPPPVQQPLDGLANARPFLKWVGGKRQVIKQLLHRVPSSHGTYHEPFVGGGALFFALQPVSAILSDTNERLIRAYRGIQEDVSAVVERLLQMPVSKEFFSDLRRYPIDATSNVEVAAWMIYLNKTAYNGLYRVNRRGEFNTPFGRYDNPTICDADNLRACARVLRSATVKAEDFEAVLGRATAGDLVYFDPPYVPVSDYSDFTRYTAQQFGLADHKRLRDVALELKRRRVNVLISNSVAPEVFSLYEEHFRIEQLKASRFVNCDPEKRGKVIETLMS